jgi:hypothetical protein
VEVVATGLDDGYIRPQLVMQKQAERNEEAEEPS